MVFYWALAYLAGSLPFALWITRLVKNIDVRDGGSGHVGATNTIRQAGFGAGFAVLILDIISWTRKAQGKASCDKE